MKPLQTADAQRLVEALDQEIRSRGRGAIRAVDRSAGYSEGWWQHRAASGDISVHQLLKILDHLGLNPSSFLRRALGPKDGLELNRPGGRPPEIVERAWERLQFGREGAGIGQTYLDTLDQRRYQEPQEILRQTLWAVDHVELALLPQLLGAAGSAWRFMFKLDEAAHTIQAGIKIAEQQGSQHTVGRLLQRLSYVVADQGDRTEALRLSEKSAVLFLRSGDHRGVGTALVDQGIWLHYIGRDQESIETLQSALDQLPDAPSRNRMAAMHCMGLAYHQLGNLRAAIEMTIEAPSAAEEISALDHAKLIWLRARIHRDLHEYDQAAALLAEVIDTYQDAHHGETALAICELAQVQLLSNQPLLAYQTIQSMRRLLEPLKHNKIVSAAIGDLLRGGQSGLTLALISLVLRHIEGERQKTESWKDLQSA